MDLGNLIYKTKNTPKVVGAIGRDATEVIAAMYRAVLAGDVKEVSSPAVAEMEKILENTYRNVNIGLVNELAMLCDKMGIDIWEVIDAAKTKPYGFQAFYPGPGLGGIAFRWTRIISLEGPGIRVPYVHDRKLHDDQRPHARILRRPGREDPEPIQKAMNGARVLVLGVAYKQDIDDYRESPAIDVIKVLKREGAEVVYYDPWVKGFSSRESPWRASRLSKELLESADLVMVTAAHTNVDYQLVADTAKAVFDTKNAMKRY